MPPVNSKKCQYRISAMSNLRKEYVTLLILGVKGHTFACFCNAGRDHQKPAPMHVRWEFQPNMAVYEQSLSALAD